MANEINARAQAGGFSYTNAYLESLGASFMPKLNEIIFTQDWYITIGKGINAYSSLKKMRWNPTDGNFYLFDGNMLVGGAFIVLSNGQLTITTGTYNAIDVSQTGQIYCDTSGGDITINGLASGVKGHTVRIIKTSSSNSLFIAHGSGSGTQKFVLDGGAAASPLTKTQYGNISATFNGSFWQTDQ